MAASVIHFGVDDCYRTRVLRRAGYEIRDCTSLVQFREILESDAEADAVMMNDSQGVVPLQAISLTRSRIAAPILLFPHPNRTYPIQQVDLIVPTFTPPAEWLIDLANLIIYCRTVRIQSQFIREQSELLRQQAAAARARSLSERQRARNMMKL